MPTHRLIFLGGVHGTGKGVFCDELGQSTPWEVLSASALIKWTEYAEDPKNLAVRSIPETQARLLAGLERECKPGGRYVLDGHFTLLDAGNNVSRVDSAIFEAIAPEAILIKTENAIIVHERLQQRDGRVYPLALIEHMLAEEATYSEELARHFNVPYLVIAPGREAECIAAIAAMQ
jgi:adenylate kinase